MADPAKKSAALLVFGKPGKGSEGEGMGGGEELAEARDLVKEAFGWTDEQVDALHEYVEACRSRGVG